MVRSSFLLCAAIGAVMTSLCGAQVPFQLQLPAGNAEHYRVTRFASSLGFPVGMAELPDGSLLVAESRDAAFFNTKKGTLTRLVDSDHDGIADERHELANNVPFGMLTAVRVVDDYVFVTGQGKPMGIYQLGASLNDPLTSLGQFSFSYPGSWLHPNSELVVRSTAPGEFDLIFQVGSDTNFAVTKKTATLNAPDGQKLTLAGDALHAVSISITGQSVQVKGSHQLATGLRNAAGLAFHPETGDLYLAENGIDGVIDANEPTSSDEIDVIPAAALSQDVVDFGFPERYVQYRTGTIIGQDQPGVDPLVHFEPLGDPQTGSEAQGPNQIAFVPDSFPAPLHGGLIVTMHGIFGAGGIANEENPLMFVDLNSLAYRELVGNNEAGVGHLDGVMSTADSLFVTDMTPQGGLAAAQANSGVIYQIQSLYPSIDALAAALRQGDTASKFDVNRDATVNADDWSALIHDINDTHYGDANLNGTFDSNDLIEIFARGRYELDVAAGWAQGDWNGDGRFNTDDLIAAFQEGAYDATPAAAMTSAVPEPVSSGLLLTGMSVSILCRRRRVR